MLKIMWRVLGLNLDEKNVERIVGILEIMEVLYVFVDKDCVIKDKSY